MNEDFISSSMAIGMRLPNAEGGGAAPSALIEALHPCRAWPTFIRESPRRFHAFRRFFPRVFCAVVTCYAEAVCHAHAGAQQRVVMELPCGGGAGLGCAQFLVSGPLNE